MPAGKSSSIGKIQKAWLDGRFVDQGTIRGGLWGIAVISVDHGLVLSGEANHGGQE